MNEFNETARLRLEKLSSTNVSDALDALGLSGATHGIRPMLPRWNKIVGPAVTMKLVPAGTVPQKTHLGMHAIAAARPGDVIVIENEGRMDSSCWGGILANAAKVKGLSGTVIDGVCRDIPAVLECGYPIFSKGYYMRTGKDRVYVDAVNVPVKVSNISVFPGDIILGDDTGVVVVPEARAEEVAGIAENIDAKEQEIITLVEQGCPLKEARAKTGYHHLQTHETGR